MVKREGTLKNEFTISRSAELTSLGIFREFIDSVCLEHPEIDSATRYDLKLAVDEACTNIISHGYAGINPGSMILTIELEKDRIILTITDFGHSFEPSEPPAPDMQAVLEGQHNGGFGLYLIYQSMDQVDYQASPDGNHLTLVKRLTPEIPKA